MATTVSDSSDDATRYRTAQLGLTRLLVRDVRGLRRLILPSRLRESVPDWLTAMNAVIVQYARTSGSLAAEFYDAQREAAGMSGPFTVPLAEPPPEEQVTASLRWATKDLWPRDPDEATPAQLQPMDVRLEQAETKAEQVAQKLVADTGRGTVREAVRQDRQATAWARAAALGACAFCKLLASRGAVYAQDTADFRAHDGCHCGVIPVFKGQRFELSRQAREWERIYREYAEGHPGDQLRLFRRALAEYDSNPLPGSH
ncbi:hypothetical protein [Streptomyces indicus]|uniref:Capsid maturation protease n=1 Tax=Streptomyces indicus TaxID=417292 RepID=A0A1G9IS97_9ACTN|nr:hypothetical protein [Streptomyces indicus]SDL27853.1 hypothetical protein SAMN05421806_12530 [Streptomyces indicus]